MLSNSGMKAGNESQACSYIRGGEDGDSVATLASIRQHRNKTYISQLGVGREHPNQEVSPPPPPPSHEPKSRRCLGHDRTSAGYLGPLRTAACL